MDSIHILTHLVHGPCPQRGSMDQGEMEENFKMTETNASASKKKFLENRNRFIFKHCNAESEQEQNSVEVQ